MPTEHYHVFYIWHFLSFQRNSVLNEGIGGGANLSSSVKSVSLVPEAALSSPPPPPNHPPNHPPLLLPASDGAGAASSDGVVPGMGLLLVPN